MLVSKGLAPAYKTNHKHKAFSYSIEAYSIQGDETRPFPFSGIVRPLA
jgi:hypothetical protein